MGLKVVPPADPRYCENVTGVDTSQFAEKNNSSSLKPEIDKLYIDKLVTNPNDLSKLNDVVKKVVKKTVYDELHS